LEQLGYHVTRGSGGLHVGSSAGPSGSQGSYGGGYTLVSESKATRVEAIARAHRRLAEATKRGGYIALKAPLRRSVEIGEAIAAFEGVTAVNVGKEFTRFLHEVRDAEGKPSWKAVLAADSEDAPPNARRGFGQLLQQTWTRLESHVRAAGGSGIVLLHDATPLARYTGGLELLARLAGAARDASESPHGLWLLCPMEDPQGFPLLDRQTVSVIPGDAEQLYVPEGFGSGGRLIAS
jgi:hypothetical protein